MLALSLLPEDATLLYLTEFGSVLYGTNTPASGTDLKGIYLPSIKSCILEQAPETITHTKFPLDAAPYITLIKLCNDVTLLPEHLDNIASMLAATEELVEASTLPDIIEPQLRNTLKWYFFQGQINGN